MASVYPGALDTFATDKANATLQEDDHPEHHNDLADAINKLEAELGINPSDSFSTVKARLDDLEVSAGAPDDATYLVTAAHADLSAEVVVGATPGGELGNTWASPTVDATHSGSSHAAIQAAAEATAAAALAAHLADATDAHDASAISILDAANDFTATDVEGALAELQSDAEADAAALAAHLADAIAAHAASAIAFTPGGGVMSDTVQEAIEEVAALAGGGVVVKDNGSTIGSRAAINFHEGSSISFDIVDDPGNDEVDVTIAASEAAIGSFALFNYLTAR